MEKRKYTYGNLEVMMDASLTPEQVQELWSAIYPELAHARIVNRDNGAVEFLQQAADKGN